MVLKINYQKIIKPKASIFVSIFFLSIFFFNSFCFAAETIQETVAQRAVSRLRRTNDRSVLQVHEDHEDNENAENGVVQPSQDR